MDFFYKFFKLKEKNTNIQTELIAGTTTFFTMAYMYILSPKILQSAGLNFYSSISITAIIIFIGCFLMAFIANKPYAVAPFIGETAFISYTIVSALGFSVQSSLSAIIITGVIMLILTLFNLRVYIINRIPQAIKLAFCLGLGLYFIYISLKDIGILTLTQPNNGNISTNTIIHSLLGIFCLILLIILNKLKLKIAILLPIIITTIIGILIKDIQLPSNIISFPHNITASMFQLDFTGVLKKDFIPIFILIFILANIDTSGSLTGVIYKENQLQNKKITNDDELSLKKCMIADSITTVIAPLFGTTTCGVFTDSLTGISTGGKSGLTALTTGILFILGLFFTPLIIITPSYAYAPVLLYVGILLISTIKNVNFDDIIEFSTVIISASIMIFTLNIGLGIIAGMFLYPCLKLLSGKKHEISIIQWLMFLISIIFFIIYPY